MRRRPGQLQRPSYPRGSSVVSVDPLYRLDAEVIRERIAETYNRILEQTRANQHQIFPLIALDGSPSRHVPGIVESLRTRYEVRLDAVPYEFQRGGNRMMRIQPAASPAFNATSLE